MNYFAHGLRFVDQPYVLVGTAVPDWLNVVDRRVRARSKAARPFVDDADPRVAQIARGIVQHHWDDGWFHQTRAFAELSLELTVRIRDWLAPDAGFRPSFLGHILVEILLDAELIAGDPAALDRYYESVRAVDPCLVQRTVSRIAARDVPRLAEWIPVFCQERFLYDYARDEKLLARLNRVMQRVGLPVLPASFVGLLPEARELVRQQRETLLAAPSFATTGFRPEPSQGDLPCDSE